MQDSATVTKPKTGFNEQYDRLSVAEFTTKAARVNRPAGTVMYIVIHMLSGRVYRYAYTNKDAAEAAIQHIKDNWRADDLNYKFLKSADNCDLR